MKKILALAALVALSACGPAVVKDGELKAHLTTQGYTKILIRPGKLNCGQFGQGKHFLGTRKDGMALIGQICYKRVDGKLDFNVAVNKEIGQGKSTVKEDKPSKPATEIKNPWKG